MRYRKIQKEHPNVGFAREDLKSACERMRAESTIDRQVGAGRRRRHRTSDALGSLMGFFGDRETASRGDAVSSLEIPKTTARRIVIEALGLRSLRKIAAQRAKPENAAKPLEMCEIPGRQFRRGELGEMEILFTDENVSRRGACPGAGSAFRIIR